jgi:CubicO group peptidase (beta-lactamase class C family)
MKSIRFIFTFITLGPPLNALFTRVLSPSPANGVGARALAATPFRLASRAWKSAGAWLVAAICVLNPSVQAAISGRPVPDMTVFDTLMTTFLSNNSIESAVLGIMHDGRIQYLRGFGLLDAGVDMPENALVRLASCTKPVTAAAMRRLDAQSSINVTDFAFNVNGNGGVLNYAPFPSLGDNRIDDITINHLLQHRGGWDRSTAGDLTYMETTIADDMGVGDPPGRGNTMRWILGQPLQFTPGSRYEYSNIGYLALGLIISLNTGPGYIGHVHQQVLTPNMWVPATEIQAAHTFRADRNPREPWYRSTVTAVNVYDPSGPSVLRPYGGFDVEARLGQGGVLASAAAMLELAERYHISPGSSIIGLPIDGTNPLSSEEAHNGAYSGVNTFLWHRTDDTVVFVFFNRDKSEVSSGHYGSDFVGQLDPILDAGTQFTWPGTTSDGFWVTLGSELPTTGLGGYHSTYRGFASALSRCESGSKIRLRSGSQTFVGTLDKPLLIDAPLGSATLGQ